MGCIYKITNKINNHLYIGQTSRTIKLRWIDHLYSAYNHRSYKGKDQYYYPIHAAIRKYGEENFQITEIEECENSLLNEREKYWIEYYNSYKNGYNASLGGDGHQKYNYDEIVEYYLNHNNSLKETCLHFNIYDQIVYTALKTKNIDYKNLPKTHGKKVGKKIKLIELNIIFNSMAEIDEYFHKKVHPNIRRCLNGTTKKAYGYHWQEVD